MSLSQGEMAVINGKRAEEVVASHLNFAGYTKVSAPTLQHLTVSRRGLFAEAGCYAKQCLVPLLASYHGNHKYESKIDFAVLPASGNTVLISVKSQTSDGSAEEKLEYEIQQLISTELPSGMVVLGPVKGRDAKTGWNEHVLQQIWDRTKHYGSGRIYLFRSPKKMSKWIDDGLPVAGGSRTWSSVFMEYCDREP